MEYKNTIIHKIKHNGFYRAYINDHFEKADTLEGIKKIIDEKIK